MRMCGIMSFPDISHVTVCNTATGCKTQQCPLLNVWLLVPNEHVLAPVDRFLSVFTAQQYVKGLSWGYIQQQQNPSEAESTFKNPQTPNKTGLKCCCNTARLWVNKKKRIFWPLQHPPTDTLLFLFDCCLDLNIFVCHQTLFCSLLCGHNRRITRKTLFVRSPCRERTNKTI